MIWLMVLWRQAHPQLLLMCGRRALSDCVVVVTPGRSHARPGLRDGSRRRWCGPLLSGPLAADALAQAVRDADGLLCGLDT